MTSSAPHLLGAYVNDHLVGGKLASASTPAGSGQRPALTRSADGTVHLQLVSSGPHTGASRLDVQLASSVAWTIELDGGATDEHVDMRAGQLALVGVPPTVVSSVQVNGGAGSLVLAGTTHTGIGGSQTFTQPGYENARQRLQILLQGGVSSVVVGAPTT